MEEASGRRQSRRDGVRNGDGIDRSSREFFDQFVRYLPEPVLVADGAGMVVTGNEEVSEVFGREVPALRGRPLEALFSELRTEALEANCGSDVGEYVTCRVDEETGDGPWVELACERYRIGGQGYFVCVIHDVTARHDREQTLEQYERIMETIDDGVYTLDESFTIETINSAVESMTGYDEEELVGASAAKLTSESVIEKAAQLQRELLSGDREVATLTADLETADGESLPVETRFSPYPLPDGQHSHVGVVRDISDRRRFERTLAALHDSTRALLTAGTTVEVSQLVVEAALDVLGITGAAIYLFDREDGVLRPSFAAGSHAETTADHPIVRPDDGPVWESFVESDVVGIDGDESDSPIESGICLPLGSYGVFAVAIDAAEHDADTAEVLDMLAASAEAGLARVAREQSLWKRDEKLQERNRQLRRFKEVNTIIRQIDQVLVDADTREEIEQAVCKQLATSRWVSFVWIGRPGEAELEPGAWAGDAPSYLDAVSLSTAGDGGPPAVQVARSDSMRVVPSIADGVPDDHWRVEAVTRDFQSVTSVPLRDGDLTYGVLSVYGTKQSAFEEILQPVFSELGTTIANAIREVESRQRRAGPTVVELEVSLTAPAAVLGQLADRIGAPVVCEGTVPHEDDATQLFFRVEDDALDPAEIRDRGADLTRVESLSPIGGEEAALFKAVVSGETVPGAFVTQGARVDSIRADTGTTELTAVVNLPAGIDVRDLVESLEARYPGARLAARRERGVSDRTAKGIRTTLRERLTDRQLQVLMTAHLSGFFDWPRRSTGQELADKLDISQPTMSRHLRVSQRKLLDLVFDDA